MLRLNLVLLAVLIASGLYVVRTSYEARRLFSALESERQRERQLQVEYEQLEVAKRAQATPSRVEKIAREKLRMANASPAVTHYLTEQGARPVPTTIVPASGAAAASTEASR